MLYGGQFTRFVLPNVMKLADPMNSNPTSKWNLREGKHRQSLLQQQDDAFETSKWHEEIFNRWNCTV